MEFNYLCTTSAPSHMVPCLLCRATSCEAWVYRVWTSQDQNQGKMICHLMQIGHFFSQDEVPARFEFCGALMKNNEGSQCGAPQNLKPCPIVGLNCWFYLLLHRTTEHQHVDIVSSHWVGYMIISKPWWTNGCIYGLSALASTSTIILGARPIWTA